MGIDPVTHKPKSDTLSSADGQSTKSIANLSHMAQWESARLEAEARLVRESKLRASSTSTATSLQSPLQQLDTAVLLPQLHNKSVSNMTMSSLDVIHMRQGIWPKSTTGNQGQIDLQSPTSTLSFSAESMVQPSMGFAGQNSTIICHQEDKGLEGEELEFKCFGKPIRLSDTKDQRIDDLTATGFSMNMNTVFSAEASWLIPESSGIRIETSSRNLGSAGLFTEMLLDNSDEQNSCANDSDNAETGSCMEEEDQDEDETNSYWNNILDLVNSSPPSNSPPPVL